MGDTGVDELGFYRERSLSVRLTRFLVEAVGLFLYLPIMLLWSAFLLFAFSFIFSNPVTRAGTKSWQDSIMIITMIALQLLISVSLSRFLRRICYGRPWFGKLSKEPRSLVATVLRASGELSFKLDDANGQLIQKLASLNRDTMKWSMGRQYRKAYLNRVNQPAVNAGQLQGPGRREPDDIEAQWNDIWQEQVLKSSSGGRTVAQAFEPDAYAFVTVPLRLTGLHLAVSGLTWFYETTVLWLLLSHLESGSSLLPVFQAAVGFSVATTLIIFLYHTYKLPEIPILSPREMVQQFGWTLTPKQRGEIADFVTAVEGEFKDLATFQGKSISVTSVKVSSRYLGLVRNYYARTLAYECVQTSLVGFVLILIAIAFAWVFGIKNLYNTYPTYERLAIALALMPPSILMIHFLVFTLVAQFRRFATLAITGALIAFIPPAATYLATGRLPAGPVTFVSSTIVAIIGSAGADLALRNRKKIGESSDISHAGPRPSDP